MIKLNNYAKIIKFSQKGEDGILNKIFTELNITQGYFCEFGAGDGVSNCNTFPLHESGWSGLYIELDSKRFNGLFNLHKNNPKISMINSKISLEKNETLDYYLKSVNAPKDLDLLSIDIDGNDLWVWNSLTEHNPKVVITEYNSQYPSDSSMTIAYDKNHEFNNNDYYGASAGAFNKLAKSKGYSLVAYTTGLNLIFLRDDLNKGNFEKLDVASIPIHHGWPQSSKRMIEF